jgi:Winged helix DNA-binding domain
MSTTATLEVPRAAVLAVRAVAQGLDRRAERARDVPVLDVGVQDSPPGSALLAFAARTATPDAAHWAGDAELAVAWTLRGAPHVHRRDDLPALGRALWPHDDADAAARLAWNASRVAESGRAPLEALALTAQAVADVAALDPSTLDGTGLPPVEGPDGEVGLGKGLLSREVTRRLPRELRRWCEPCRSEHVSDQLLRLAALPGGLAVVSSAPLVFGRVGDGGVPSSGGDLAPLVRAYLRLFAPAAPADVKAFLGTTSAVVKAHWPDDAVPVRVDGRSAWALPAEVELLADPPRPPDVRLLPPNDLFLKAGDRDVLVPDTAERKAMFKVLGNPGVLLVDGVPAGVWRPKASGRRLDVTVETFGPLPDRTRTRVTEEAERMATVRDLTLGTVRL